MRITAVVAAVLCVAGLSAPALAAAATDADAPAPATYAPLNYAAMDKLGWKLSCQAYTFRELSLFETIDLLHRLGIHYIELFPGQRFSPDQPVGFDHHSPPAMVDALIAKLKSAGVTPVSYGVVGLGNDEAEDRRVFDFARKLHLPNITSEPSPDCYNLLDRLTAEYKINVAIHDHPRPDYYWNPDTVLRVIAGHSKRIGACADTGHWFRSDLWPVACLHELQGHIIELHFKDLSANKEDRPWGHGVCDASGQLIELAHQHFRGVFSIEYESTSGAVLVNNVAQCCRFFSDTAAKLADLR